MFVFLATDMAAVNLGQKSYFSQREVIDGETHNCRVLYRGLRSCKWDQPMNPTVNKAWGPLRKKVRARKWGGLLSGAVVCHDVTIVVMRSQNLALPFKRPAQNPRSQIPNPNARPPVHGNTKRTQPCFRGLLPHNALCGNICLLPVGSFACILLFMILWVLWDFCVCKCVGLCLGVCLLGI